MGNKELFKTVLFGGFQKEEVWNYMQEVEAEIEGGRQVAERAQQEYAQQLEEDVYKRQQHGCCPPAGRNHQRDGGVHKGAGFLRLCKAGGILQCAGR